MLFRPSDQLPVFKSIMGLTTNMKNPTHKQAVRVAAIIADETTRNGLVENCVMCTMMIHSVFKELKVRHQIRSGYLSITPNQFESPKMITHAWVEVDNLAIDIGNNNYIHHLQYLQLHGYDVDDANIWKPILSKHYPSGCCPSEKNRVAPCGTKNQECGI